MDEKPIQIGDVSLTEEEARAIAEEAPERGSRESVTVETSDGHYAVIDDGDPDSYATVVRLGQDGWFGPLREIGDQLSELEEEEAPYPRLRATDGASPPFGFEIPLVQADAYAIEKVNGREYKAAWDTEKNVADTREYGAHCEFAAENGFDGHAIVTDFEIVTEP